MFAFENELAFATIRTIMFRHKGKFFLLRHIIAFAVFFQRFAGVDIYLGMSFGRPHGHGRFRPQHAWLRGMLQGLLVVESRAIAWIVEICAMHQRRGLIESTRRVVVDSVVSKWTVDGKRLAAGNPVAVVIFFAHHFFSRAASDEKICTRSCFPCF